MTVTFQPRFKLDGLRLADQTVNVYHGLDPEPDLIQRDVRDIHFDGIEGRSGVVVLVGTIDHEGRERNVAHVLRTNLTGRIDGGCEELIRVVLQFAETIWRLV